MEEHALRGRLGAHPWWAAAGKPRDLVGFLLWTSMSAAWQVLSEVTEDNLIDLGPGSPAVVSPTVGNTAPPSSLSSQLAGLGECPRPPPTSWPQGGPWGSVGRVLLCQLQLKASP